MRRDTQTGESEWPGERRVAAIVAEKATLLGQVDQKLAGRTAHLMAVKLLEQAWPDSYASILTANNEHPPLVLRVDLSRKSKTPISKNGQG